MREGGQGHLGVLRRGSGTLHDWFLILVTAYMVNTTDPFYRREKGKSRLLRFPSPGLLYLSILLSVLPPHQNTSPGWQGPAIPKAIDNAVPAVILGDRSLTELSFRVRPGTWWIM